MPKQTNNLKENIKQQQIATTTNNNTNKPVNNPKKPMNPKDSIDDFDDMLQDFEKKYSSSNITTIATNNSTITNNNKPLPKSGKVNIININTNSSKNTNSKTSQNNSTINNNTIIRDSIFAQFKDDPIFSELLQTNTIATSNKMNNKNSSDAIKPSNILNNANNTNYILNSPLNYNSQRKNSVLETNKMLDTNNTQKKKFDDLFNNFNDSSVAKTNANNYPNKNSSFFSDKKNFEDILFDDENIKPSGKKPNKPANNQNNINYFQEINGSNSNTNKRKGQITNQTKSGRKDILEEIFGDDLFASIRGHTPSLSKNRPQISKMRNNNKYDDMFTINKNGNKGIQTVNIN